ncbi:MAG: hypothetical protein AAGD00_08190 [Planctomycetota bacterium]
MGVFSKLFKRSAKTHEASESGTQPVASRASVAEPKPKASPEPATRPAEPIRPVRPKAPAPSQPSVPSRQTGSLLLDEDDADDMQDEIKLDLDPEPTRPVPAPRVETRPSAVSSGEREMLDELSREKAPINVPSNRKELLDELQRNYREVLELVRKVDTHLDEQRHRGDQMAQIAARVDQALPQLERMPQAINEHARELNAQLISAIEETAIQHRDADAKTFQALTGIADRLRESGDHQEKLTTTMAEFRETMNGVANSSERSTDLLQRIHERNVVRDEEMTKMLVTSRRWTIVAVAGALAVASIAVVFAIAALTQSAG